MRGTYGSGSSISGEDGRSEFYVGALTEGDAGTGAESSESASLGSSGAPEEEDVDGSADQSRKDDDHHRSDDGGRRNALRRRRTTQKVRLAVDALEIRRTLALNFAVVGAHSAVLAGTAERRRTLPLHQSVARHFASALTLSVVWTSAAESSRNQKTQVRAL